MVSQGRRASFFFFLGSNGMTPLLVFRFQIAHCPQLKKNQNCFKMKAHVVSKVNQIMVSKYHFPYTK